ncbi:MAG: GDSL-type esterase/lipase family protein [Prevotellaceae bacterium]|nr:GDSL-type esterase/lipase family protein [Prevotellaceae bacterium]
MLPLSMMAQTNRYESMKDVNNVTDLTLDSLNKAQAARPVSGSSRKGDNPVLFLVGNSTMRNGTLGNGNNGQWGWGYFEHLFWDENKITVENHALGGTSTRTFYRNLWPAVLKGIKKGDYVILELGHNDNGPLDSGRARASIKGVGNDSVEVTIKDGPKAGAKEWVYTFGGYVRKYVEEIRAKGATPILFTLTPRNDYEKSDSTKIQRKLESFTPWIFAMGKELNVPVIDLNDISAKKLEGYGKWKTNYFFFGDKIHSSEFGAKMNAASCAEGINECNDPQLAMLKTYILPQMITAKRCDQRREKGKPVVFITGDSTVKNFDKDADGMWGWGSQAATIFDEKKCTPINAAKAGRSTRTYLEEGRWDEVYNSIEPGDYVLIQFGHNDIGGIDRDKERGVIATAKDTCHVYKLKSNGKYKVIYSFGWYLKKFIQDVREKGGTPILLSLTPRNEWKDGKIERRNDTYGKWYREVAEETGVELVDVHNITADYLDKHAGSKEKCMPWYNHDHTHTSLKGAQLNAKSVAKGLKKIKSPLAKYLK